MTIYALAAGEQFTTGFWGAVGFAAAIATALATAASTAVAIWWRLHDRAEAEWVVRVTKRGGDGSRGTVAAPQMTLSFENVGDGVAHKIEVVASGDAAKKPYVFRPLSGGMGGGVQVDQPIAMMRTGDAVQAIVYADDFAAWDTTSVKLTWWPPPTRRRKKWIFWTRQLTQEFPFSSITTAPTDV